MSSPGNTSALLGEVLLEAIRGVVRVGIQAGQSQKGNQGGDRC